MRFDQEGFSLELADPQVGLGKTLAAKPQFGRTGRNHSRRWCRQSLRPKRGARNQAGLVVMLGFGEDPGLVVELGCWEKPGLDLELGSGLVLKLGPWLSPEAGL